MISDCRLQVLLPHFLPLFKHSTSASERSEIHRAQAARYGSMKRKVELALSQIGSEENEILAVLQKLILEWEGTALDSPLTKFKILEKINSKKKRLEKINCGD